MSESTVTLPTVALPTVADIAADLLSGVSESYSSAEQGIKSKVRSTLDKIVKDSLRSRAFDEATAAQDALDLATSTSKIKAAKEIDYSALLADRVEALLGAAAAIMAGHLPEGIDEDMIDWDVVNEAARKVERDVWEPTESMIKVAKAKITKSTDRVDIEAHVAEVIADVEPGTFLKISEVARVRTEAAPEGLPSQGALAARLFAKGGCTLDGVEPVEASATAPKGLRVL